MARRRSDDTTASPGASDDPFVRLYESLRRKLEKEIRRDGFWKRPSALIGHTTARDCKEILDDLLQEFVRRRITDMRKVAQEADIGAYVGQYIHVFLVEQRERHDPVGHALFSNLEKAARRLEAEGTFTLRCRVRGKIREDTELTAVGAEIGASCSGKHQLSIALSRLPEWHRLLVEWREVVAEWAELRDQRARSEGESLGEGAESGSDQRTRINLGRPTIKNLMCACLIGLPSQGVRSFLFGHVLELLKKSTGEGRREFQLDETWGRAARDGALGDSEAVAAFLSAMEARITDELHKGVFQRYIDWALHHPGDPFPIQADVARDLGVDRRRVSDACKALRMTLRSLVEDPGWLADGNAEAGHDLRSMIRRFLEDDPDKLPRMPVNDH
jgi:hypothetical protein